MSTPRALLVAVVLSLVATRSSRAQTATPREQLEAAHTAFLVNAGAGAGTFEDLTRALQQWGRFTLVEDVAQSDITKRTSSTKPSGAGASGRPWSRICVSTWAQW
jgi:hypothetical protein